MQAVFGTIDNDSLDIRKVLIVLSILFFPQEGRTI